jgi:hypothetical protein
VGEGGTVSVIEGILLLLVVLIFLRVFAVI